MIMYAIVLYMYVYDDAYCWPTDTCIITYYINPLRLKKKCTDKENN